MSSETDETTATDAPATHNGQAGPASAAKPPMDPEVARKIASLRAALRENFGKVVMALMMVPRYKAQMVGDLQHLVLDPMLQDRLAIAYKGTRDAPQTADMAGFAIWASVSDEVDARIREQIKQGVFPVRLRPEDWNSGKINWLLDVIATDRATITTVISNFRQVVKEGELRLHPLISRLVDGETLEKMGARRSPAPAASPAPEGKAEGGDGTA